MHLPTDTAVWLKVFGGIFSGMGSLVFVWRAKSFFTAIADALVAHEHAIQILTGKLEQDKKTPVLLGLGLSVADFESKLGLVLLVIGGALFGIGMLLTAASYFF